MELINTKESYCMYCLSEHRKVISLKIVDNEIDMCEDCLTKALLMIRPMELKSMDGADILGYLEMVVEHNIIRNAEEKHLKDMKVFLEWAKQILETKK